jgi:hypothetical protein
MTVVVARGETTMGTGRSLAMAASGLPACGPARRRHGMIDLPTATSGSFVGSVRLRRTGSRLALPCHQRHASLLGGQHLGRLGGMGCRRQRESDKGARAQQPQSTLQRDVEEPFGHGRIHSSRPYLWVHHLHGGISLAPVGKVCAIGSSSIRPPNLLGFWCP